MKEVRSRGSSTLENEPLFPELVAAASLCFLDGDECPKSIADIYGMLIISTDRIIRLFLKAVINCDSLLLWIPGMKADFEKGACDFTNISWSFGLYLGVVGVINVWLLCLAQKPFDDQSVFVNTSIGALKGANHLQSYNDYIITLDLFVSMGFEGVPSVFVSLLKTSSTRSIINHLQNAHIITSSILLLMRFEGSWLPRKY